MPDEKTTIQVSTTTRTNLNAWKAKRNLTYDAAIHRLLDFAMEFKKGAWAPESPAEAEKVARRWLTFETAHDFMRVLPGDSILRMLEDSEHQAPHDVVEGAHQLLEAAGAHEAADDIKQGATFGTVARTLLREDLQPAFPSL